MKKHGNVRNKTVGFTLRWDENRREYACADGVGVVVASRAFRWDRAADRSKNTS